MIIVVNARFLISNRLDGIGWFSYETLKRITNQHQEHQFIFLFDRPYSKEFIFSSNITPVVVRPPARHPFLWYWWFQYAVPRVLQKYKADLFLSPDGYLSLRTDVPQLPVIHDINFHHYPEHIPWLTSNYLRQYFPRFAHKAVRIATVSHYSKQDIAQSYQIDPQKIDVVNNGSNSIYSPLQAADIIEVKKQLTQGNDYFIFVGSLLPRKNISRLLRAFDMFKKRSATNSSIDSGFKLVIVGAKMFKTKEMEEVYNQLQHQSDVIFTGRMQGNQLRYVLGAATALTFVPYFEGFGIPILEAMYADVPVLASNVTSMPEVAGEAGLMVDPFSEESICEGMLQLAGKPLLREDLIEKGRMQRMKFSWQLTSELLWNSMMSALKHENIEEVLE